MWPVAYSICPPMGRSTQAHCDKFAKHFANKVDQLHHDLDAMLGVSSDVPGAPVYSSFWDSFQLIEPEDVDRIFWRRKPSCLLDPCLAWLIRSTWGDLVKLTGRVVNISLREGMLPLTLKQAVVHSLLKKPSLDPTNLNNF